MSRGTGAKHSGHGPDYLQNFTSGGILYHSAVLVNAAGPFIGASLPRHLRCFVAHPSRWPVCFAHVAPRRDLRHRWGIWPNLAPEAATRPNGSETSASWSPVSTWPVNFEGGRLVDAGTISFHLQRGPRT